VSGTSSVSPAYVPPAEALKTLEALTAEAVQQLAERRSYLAHTVNEAPTEAGKMYSAKAQICEAAVAVLDRRIDEAEHRGDEHHIASRRKSADGRPTLTRGQLTRLKATRDALKARGDGLDSAAHDGAGQLARPSKVVGPKMLGGFKALRHLPSWIRQKAELASHLRTLSGKPGGTASLDTPVVDEQTIVETALAQAFHDAGLSPSQARHEMHGEMNRQLNAQRWDPITTEIQLQVGPETNLAYSEITPAAAFFPSYEGQGFNSHSSTEGQHAVNLAQTRLVDGQGQELFSAMRHGVVSAFGIVERNIDAAHMSDEELTQVVVNAAPNNAIGAHGQGANVVRTAAHVRQNAATVVPVVRAIANVRRAEEIVQAMILADRELFDRAVLAAKPAVPQVLGRSSTVPEQAVPTLDVLSISLLTPDHVRSGVDSNERLMLADQRQAWTDIEGERSFSVPHPDTGEMVRVKVDVRPHAVNYGVNQGAVKGFGPFTSNANFVSGWDDVAPVNNQALTRLLGIGRPAATAEEAQRGFELSLLGPRLLALHAKADVAAYKVEQLLAEEATYDVLSDERDERGESARTQARAILKPRIDAAAAEAVAARQRATLAQELLDQVREIHRDGSYRTAGKEPYKMPARLALLGHMLGVKVAFNCKSGKDRTGELDAEVKHLRLQMELTGHVPHYARDRTPTERDHFHEVMTHSGNFEMQRLNTRYAGYKLHGVSELFAEFGSEGPDDSKGANFHGMSGYTES
jgi:Enterobacterial virulence protein IpgD